MIGGGDPMQKDEIHCQGNPKGGQNHQPSDPGSAYGQTLANHK